MELSPKDWHRLFDHFASAQSHIEELDEGSCAGDEDPSDLLESAADHCENGMQILLELNGGKFLMEGSSMRERKY